MRSWRFCGLVVAVEHFDVARSRQQFTSMCGVDFDTGPSVPAVRSALILGDHSENRAGSTLDSVSSGGSSGAGAARSENRAGFGLERVGPYPGGVFCAVSYPVVRLWSCSIR